MPESLQSIPKFIPHPLLRSGHLQTLMARMFNEPADFNQGERLFVNFPDGDRVYFQIDSPSEKSSASTPIVVLFHGLAGCSESPYNLRISKKLTKLGFRVARYSHRGCGPMQQMMAKEIYHSGSSNDLFHSLNSLYKRWPEAPLFLVGFSLSGSILLNLLGRIPDVHISIPTIRKAAAICPPIDLEESSKRLSRLQNIIYDQYFTHFLLRQVKKREAQFGLEQTKFTSKFVTLKKFDEEFTSLQAGFKNRADYYYQCSPARIVSKIKCPTFILGAFDDPVVSTDSMLTLPPNPALSVRIEQSGGHMGFISRKRTRSGDFRWMDQMLTDWIS